MSLILKESENISCKVETYRIVKLKNGKYTTQFQYKKCKDIWFFADSCDVNRLIPVEYDTPEEAKAQQLNNFISEVVEEYII